MASLTPPQYFGSTSLGENIGDNLWVKMFESTRFTYSPSISYAQGLVQKKNLFCEILPLIRRSQLESVSSHEWSWISAMRRTSHWGGHIITQSLERGNFYEIHFSLVWNAKHWWEEGGWWWRSGQFVTGFPYPLFASETLCLESDWNFSSDFFTMGESGTIQFLSCTKAILEANMSTQYQMCGARHVLVY